MSPAGQLSFDRFDPRDERRREALLTLANGRLSLRGALPELSTLAPDGTSYPGLYHAGWYDRSPRQVADTEVRLSEVRLSEARLSALIRLPDPLGLNLGSAQHWYDPRRQPPLNYHYALDLQTACLIRDFEVRLDGLALAVNERRFVSAADPRLIVLRWTLCNLGPAADLRLRATLDAGVENALIERNATYEGRRLILRQQLTRTTGAAVRVAPLAGRGEACIATLLLSNLSLDWEASEQGPRLQHDSLITLASGQSLTLEKRIVVAVEEETTTCEAALDQLAAGAETCFAELERSHAAVWAERWSGLQLETAPSLQRKLNFAAFHLLQTVDHQGSRDQGLPPRGWQEGYFGQIFWDEIFALPWLASHFPQAARGLLDYRHRRLDQARERARRRGWRGALFPWRSGVDGAEETPPYQYFPLSGHWVRDQTFLQYHLGLAVAHNAWQFYLATGDLDFLGGVGGELILEVARCCASQASFDDRLQRYRIRGVVGPDEYHDAYPDAEAPGLDDNAYTNLLAAWTLECASRVLDLLPADQARALCERLGLEPGETADWAAISANLHLPFREDGVLDQFSGFGDLLPAPPEWLADHEGPRLDWWLEARGDSCNRYQLSKQADTLMALHLLPQAELQRLLGRLGYRLDDAGERKTLDYHLARLSHESSLSKAVCAGALAAYDSQASWTFFSDSLDTDLGAAADSGAREGIHLAAMAGTLDVLQRHYLGLWPTPDGLRVQPAPPAALPATRLQLLYRGRLLQVGWEPPRLSVRLADPAAAPVKLLTSAGTVELRGTVVWSWQRD
ncbi:hypothetical protein BJP27_00740 [Pseudomonas oryzihabitans]|nr:hypothetical protein BJP27_00740 [Pseudomonas psychrotolerans]